MIMQFVRHAESVPPAVDSFQCLSPTGKEREDKKSPKVGWKGFEEPKKNCLVLSVVKLLISDLQSFHLCPPPWQETQGT